MDEVQISTNPTKLLGRNQWLTVMPSLNWIICMMPLSNGSGVPQLSVEDDENCHKMSCLSHWRILFQSFWDEILILTTESSFHDGEYRIAQIVSEVPVRKLKSMELAAGRSVRRSTRQRAKMWWDTWKGSIMEWIQMTRCIFYRIGRMRRFKTTTDMKLMFPMNYLRNLFHIINCQSVFGVGW